LFFGKSDGERRYAKELWQLATLRLTYQEALADYGYLKVWREGLYQVGLNGHSIMEGASL